jgi:Skp family chaperone for outer membrane proteins
MNEVCRGAVFKADHDRRGSALGGHGRRCALLNRQDFSVFTQLTYRGTIPRLVGEGRPVGQPTALSGFLATFVQGELEVRSRLALAIFGLACAAVPAVAQNAPRPTSVAIIDVGYIFKNHPGIQQQIKQVEQNLEQFDKEIEARKSDLKVKVEALKQLKPDSPSYADKENELAQLDSQLRLDVGRKRKELVETEAKIYFENYSVIRRQVELVAQHNGIDLVLRYDNVEMDPSKEDTVIRGAMKSVVYHTPTLDITPMVMQLLDQHFQASPAAANAGRPQQAQVPGAAGRPAPR